jgi:hypothetical protein
LLPSAFAQLPAGDGIDAQARVRTRLFEPDLRQVMLLPEVLDTRKIQDKLEHLLSLESTTHVGLTLPSDTAARMFDEIMVWKEQKIDRTDPFAASFVKNFNDGVRSHAGHLLTIVVVPAMRAEERTEQRAQALLGFMTRARAWSSLGALPHFVAWAPSVTNDIVSAIRIGLVGSVFQHVGSAATAISGWAKLVRDGLLQELPRPLVEQLIATIETRQEAGLQGMLSAALSLLKENSLTVEDFNRLKKTLSKIRLEFRYEDVDLNGVRAVSISLVRAECVKLAVALKDRIADDGTLQAWIEEAKSDPLPEVRFSLAIS